MKTQEKISAILLMYFATAFGATIGLLIAKPGSTLTWTTVLYIGIGTFLSQLIVYYAILHKAIKS